MTNLKFVAQLENPAYRAVLSDLTFNNAMRQANFLHKLDYHVVLKMADQGVLQGMFEDQALMRALESDALRAALLNAHFLNMLEDNSVMNQMEYRGVHDALLNADFTQALTLNTDFRAAYASQGFDNAMRTHFR